MLEQMERIARQAAEERDGPYTRTRAVVSIVVDGVGFSREFTLSDSRRPDSPYGMTEKRLRAIVKRAHTCGLESSIRIVEERGGEVE